MRPYQTVAIFDPSDNIVAHFILYTGGYISGSDCSDRSFKVTDARFHEWLSFAFFIGYTVVHRLCDSEMRTKRVTHIRK